MKRKVLMLTLLVFVFSASFIFSYNYFRSTEIASNPSHVMTPGQKASQSSNPGYKATKQNSPYPIQRPKTTNKVVEPGSKYLIELLKLDNSFVVDLKYATTDNFIGKKIYSQSKCLMNKNTAQKLIEANIEFKNLGLRIKIFDAYRPLSAQKILWDAAPNKSYVANPQKGSVHNRGTAVDITLVDSAGKELPMPSSYDEFSQRAHLNYKNCSKQKLKNRELLGSIMIKHGFKRISTEWWHFNDVDANNYPILDIPFEEYK
jgi:zinc D-Ala-D-Ala dipeptidase